MEIRDFLPLPAVFDATPDPVRELVYSALRLKALHQLYACARCRSGEALSQNVFDTLQVSITLVPVRGCFRRKQNLHLT